MQKTLKNLALITTGLVVGVVIRRVGKRKKVNFEDYLDHFIDKKIEPGDINNIVPEPLKN